MREVVKMIEEALAGYNIKLTPHRLNTIARTNISKAFNQARVNQWIQIIDEVQAFQYSAILDNRTSDLCSALHGKIFKPVELEKYSPPNHYNCRSVLTPIFNFEKKPEFSVMPSTEQDSGDFLKLRKEK